MQNTTEKYHGASIALHWLMLVLIAAVYACIELRELYPKGSDPRELLKQWHFMLGLSVGMLVLIRIFFRLRYSAPVITPLPPIWQQRAAKLMHGLLYLLMLGMPLAGWMILSSAGKPVPFFGLELPALLSVNETLSEQIEELHETVGSVGYWLIGLHALAGLFHHYLIKDNTFKRMLP
ncbi:cytochrome b [Lacimicrobium alkaliphilum]|uniref:Cytochrome b561 n=1 Tax=Lacimicrobium alkaliphilum TaxID=1526571 RepID=A0ABQ1RFA6_9ALTE|nr:cytochrome b [Lacimicrobium alkaliphilum]GGD68635.1 cytochrome b561 [Lacimicrobium alkaliphilum]